MPVSDNHLITKPFSSKDRVACRWVNMKLSCNAGISIGDFRADSLIDKLIDCRSAAEVRTLLTSLSPPVTSARSSVAADGRRRTAL